MTDSKNIFYLDHVYPEPDKIFSESFKNSSELIGDAVIVLDTNVLLVPFDTAEKNVEDIKDIYLKFKKEGRLHLPARVAREFANNRANRIGTIFQQIRQLKNRLNTGDFEVNQYPILKGNPDYENLLKDFASIKDGLSLSRKHLDNLEAHIQGWTWNDNVSLAYKEIFTKEIIHEVQKSSKDIENDLIFRVEHKVAPGYKDNNKLDDGVGDLIIWQTILEIGKGQDKDVIFVTNDVKNDWFYKKDKIGLYPKYELFDEFRRFTGGRSISIINFVKFLELAKANPATIEEVKTSINEIDLDEYQSDLSKLTAGLDIKNERFGKGKVIEIREIGSDKVAVVEFTDFGLKNFLVKYARFKILNTVNNLELLNPGLFEDLDNSEPE